MLLTEQDQVFFEQPCAAHQNGICVIYGHRPQICQSYQCKLLKQYSGGEISYEQARDIINATRVHVQEVKSHFESVTQSENKRSLSRAFTSLAEGYGDIDLIAHQKKYGHTFLSYVALQRRFDRFFRKTETLSAST